MSQETASKVFINFNSRPHARDDRTDNMPRWLLGYPFPFTPRCEARRLYGSAVLDPLQVSIHAPAVGATARKIAYDRFNAFQSAPLQTGRLMERPLMTPEELFQPPRLIWTRLDPNDKVISRAEFPSSRSSEARPMTSVFPPARSRFNPRAHQKRVDIIIWAQAALKSFNSSLARSAAESLFLAFGHVSTHAPKRRGPQTDKLPVRQVISILAPRWEAAQRAELVGAIRLPFQPPFCPKQNDRNHPIQGHIPQFSPRVEKRPIQPP